MSLRTLLVAAALLTAPALAQEEPKSAACKLLTGAEAAKITGHEVMNGDDTPNDNGLMSCGWVDTETFAAIVFTVTLPEGLMGQDPIGILDANKKGAPAVGGSVEDLSDVGEKAYLHTITGEGDSLTLSLGFVKSSHVVTVNSTGVPKEGLIEAARTIASRL